MCVYIKLPMLKMILRNLKVKKYTQRRSYFFKIRLGFVREICLLVGVIFCLNLNCINYKSKFNAFVNTND